jgi:ankyrin repeat protein
VRQEAYAHWSTFKDSAFDALGIVGGPGTGKSMISTFLISHIRNDLARRCEPSERFAFFFCAARIRHRSNALAILRGWLYQLSKDNDFLVRLQKAFKAQRLDKTQILSDFPKLWQAFLEALAGSGNTQYWLLLDAFDECDVTRETLFSSLNRIHNASTDSGHIKLVFTCRRTEQALCLHLPPAQFIGMKGKAMNQDLKMVIDERVRSLAQMHYYDDDLALAVSAGLFSRSHGNQLWVLLAFRRLKQVNAEQAMDCLLSTPPEVYGFYNEELLRTPAESVENARFILHMRIAMLQEFTYTDAAIGRCLLPHLRSDLSFLAKDVPPLTKTGIQATEGRLRRCVDLLTSSVDARSVRSLGNVNFIHPSVVDYLTEPPAAILSLRCKTMIAVIHVVLGLLYLQTPLGIQYLLVLCVLPTFGASWYLAERYAVLITVRRDIILSIYLIVRRTQFTSVAARLVPHVYHVDDATASLWAFLVKFQCIVYSDPEEIPIPELDQKIRDRVQILAKDAVDSIAHYAEDCEDLVAALFPWSRRFVPAKTKCLGAWLRAVACRNDKFMSSIIKAMIAADADVDCIDPKGHTSLALAAMCGNVRGAKLLLKAGADVESEDLRERTPLYHASMHRMGRWFDVEGEDLREHTPLCQASTGMWLDVVRLLVDSGARVTSRNRTSILLSYLRRCNREITTVATFDEFIVTGHSTVFVGLTDPLPESALHGRHWFDNSRQADLHDHDSIPCCLAKAEDDTRLDRIDRSHRDGKTALSLAAELHLFNTMEILLDRGANGNKLDRHGMNALLWTLWSPRSCTVIENIIVHDHAVVWLGSLTMYHDTQTIDKIFGRKDLTKQSSPTPECIERVLKKLVAGTLDIEASTPNGRTALSLAAENAYLPMVDVLLARSADLDRRDAHGMTPLMWASRTPRIREICIRNVRVHGHGRLYLGDVSVAIASPGIMRRSHGIDDTDQRCKVVKLLVEVLALAGSNIDATDHNGWTAIHHAAKDRQVDVMRILGADVCNSSGSLVMGRESPVACNIMEFPIYSGASDTTRSVSKEIRARLANSFVATDVKSFDHATCCMVLPRVYGCDSKYANIELFGDAKGIFGNTVWVGQMHLPGSGKLDTDTASSVTISDKNPFPNTDRVWRGAKNVVVLDYASLVYFQGLLGTNTVKDELLLTINVDWQNGRPMDSRGDSSKLFSIVMLILRGGF